MIGRLTISKIWFWCECSSNTWSNENLVFAWPVSVSFEFPFELLVIYEIFYGKYHKVDLRSLDVHAGALA